MKIRACTLPLFGAAAMLVASAAFAADKAALSEAQKRYQEDRAACMSGNTSQDQATCLKEAGAALQAARRGELLSDDGNYEQNRFARCAYLQGDDRTDCERRMRGEGTVTGSIEGGGLYRELRTIVPAEEGSAATGGSGGAEPVRR